MLKVYRQRTRANSAALTQPIRPPSSPPGRPLDVVVLLLITEETNQESRHFLFPYLALHLANLIFKQINKTKTITQ
jgi:hypothetical protein